MPQVPYPDFSEHEEFIGLFVGGCVERGDGSSFRAKAHAHNSTRDPLQGWICVRSKNRLHTESGKPSQLMLHELAHLVIPDEGHTEKWKAAARWLGYRVPTRYQKKVKV